MRRDPDSDASRSGTCAGDAPELDDPELDEPESEEGAPKGVPAWEGPVREDAAREGAIATGVIRDRRSGSDGITFCATRPALIPSIIAARTRLAKSFETRPLAKRDSAIGRSASTRCTVGSSIFTSSPVFTQARRARFIPASPFSRASSSIAPFSAGAGASELIGATSSSVSPRPLTAAPSTSIGLGCLFFSASPAVWLHLACPQTTSRSGFGGGRIMAGRPRSRPRRRIPRLRSRLRSRPRAPRARPHRSRGGRAAGAPVPARP